MRLIDIEIARQAHDHGSTAARATKTTAGTALSSALQSTAFPLRAVAKFLNAFLNIVLAAAAKILCASLRSGDAHRLRRAFRSGSIEGQRCKITAISILPTAAAHHSARAATGQGGKSAIHGQALEPAAGGNQRSQVPQAALILLARRKYHL